MAANTFETSVNFSHSTRRSRTEDSHLEIVTLTEKGFNVIGFHTTTLPVPNCNVKIQAYIR
jgi:hypothetical protein